MKNPIDKATCEKEGNDTSRHRQYRNNRAATVSEQIQNSKAEKCLEHGCFLLVEVG
jgi:hypothetical protein